MPYDVNIRTKDHTDVIPDDEMVYTFEPKSDILQKHGYTGIHKGEITFMQLATGSGKTRIMNYATAYYLLKGGSVAITTPIKALSNQKYNEYVHEFIPSLEACTGKKFTVGLMTGDNKINPDADVIIMTTEILRNSLNRDEKDGNNENRLRPVFMDRLKDGCVVFDEAHYINDTDRGGVWEETIMLLPKTTNIVLLSATMDEIEKFASWISGVRERDVRLVTSSKRIVPLRHYIFTRKDGGRLHQIMTEDNELLHDKIQLASQEYKENSKDQRGPDIGMMNDLVGYMKENNLFQSIFFAFSRKNCERFAKAIQMNLVTPEESAEIEKIFDFHMHKHEKTFQGLGQYHTIRSLLIKGIGYHHSGLIPILKEIVEIIFKRGLVKILFATETFAVGINMPTRTVVFTDLEKPTNKKRRYVEAAEYMQMSGRAGRRGIDTNGTVIILPMFELPDTHSLKQIMTGKLPGIKSHLKLDYSFMMKTISTRGYDLMSFLGSSLGSRDDCNRLVALEVEQQEITERLDEILSRTVSDDALAFHKEYTKLVRPGLSENDSIAVTLTKKQKKALARLEGQLAAEPKLKEEYKFIENKQMLEKTLVGIKNEIHGIKVYMENICVELIQVLAVFGYISVGDIDTYDPDYATSFADDFITIGNYQPIQDVRIERLPKYTLTPRGRIASQINECNPILLTELIVGNLLNGLSAPEIVAVIAVFIDDSNPQNPIGKSDLQVPRKVIQVIEQLDWFAEKYMDVEKAYGYTDEKYWDIHYDYVDVAYKWASGKNINEIITGLDTYEGNFIRNMIKLYNIIKDIRCLLAIHDDQRLLPILQTIDVLLIRNEVTIKSLYLE